MARKKKSSRKHSRSRRRVSGMGAVGSMATNVLYAVAGGVAAQAVGKFLPDTLSDKVKAAIPVAVGLLLPKFVKGNLAAGVGTGMVAVGGLKLVQSFGVLSGLGFADSGYSVPQIAATYNRAGQLDTSYMTPAIAGMDELGC